MNTYRRFFAKLETISGNENIIEEYWYHFILYTTAQYNNGR
jgi:hypothetical protein